MATEPAPSGTSGRFEVLPEKFKEMSKGKSGDVQVLDLKEALPDLFVGTERVPRLVDRVWRRACDEVMAEDRGLYCYIGGTIVHTFFFDMTGAIAKVKTSLIRGKIPLILKAAQGNEAVLDAPLPQSTKPQQAAVAQGSQDLARLMKEGLPENPTPEVFRIWAQRTLQNLQAMSQKLPLTRDMIDVATRADISYLPLWSPAAQAIVGSVVTARSGVPPAQQHSGEPMRLDMASFFAAAFHLYSMQAKGQNALAVVTVRMATLVDKDAADLYIALLRRLSPEVRKNLIVEVRNLPKDSAPTSLVNAVEALSQFVRAFVFETGILSYPDFSRQFPKLHAAGFDSADVLVGDHEQVRHMVKYAETYKAGGVKAYVKNVSSIFVLNAAVKDGFAYISGPLIRPSQKTPFPAQKLAQGEIIAKG